VFRTLYSRLAAVLLGLCFGTGLVFLALVGMMVDMHQREVIQRLNWNLGQELVSDGDLLQGKRLDQPPGRDLFAMLMRINPGIEIYLLDPEGNVLSFTGPTTDVGQWKVDLQPIRGFLDGSAALPIRGDDPRDPERRKIFSVAPLNAASGGGYLYVILGGAQYAKAAAQSHRSYILGLTGWMVGASIVFAALSGLLLFAMLTRRLRHLAQVIDAFQRGDLSARVDIERSTRSRGDEIDRLGSAFNQMADRLAAQVQELKETDTLRRELVANVSHDLRTPLASLQGYLETLILKGDSLPRDEQRNYLEFAL
jgi:two-component system OmpR family sensor kinase